MFKHFYDKFYLRWHHYKQNSSQNKDSIKLIAELDQARDVLAEVSALRLELQHKSGIKGFLLETLMWNIVHKLVKPV